MTDSSTFSSHALLTKEVYQESLCLTCADAYASYRHALNDQRYRGKPYIVHCREVMRLVASVPHTEAMLLAALLHDVIEDTFSFESRAEGLAEIHRCFGFPVAEMVDWLSIRTRPSDGLRDVRKALDRARLFHAPSGVKTIKLADIIVNLSQLQTLAPKFAARYVEEKRLMLDVLMEGDSSLWHQASALVESAQTINY